MRSPGTSPIGSRGGATAGAGDGARPPPAENASGSNQRSSGSLRSRVPAGRRPRLRGGDRVRGADPVRGRFAPGRHFAVAVECGLGAALERVTLAAALRDARRLPAGPGSASTSRRPFSRMSGRMQAVLGVRARTLVLEVTEHETISAYGPLREAVIALGPDIRLAVDDAGAGSPTSTTSSSSGPTSSRSTWAWFEASTTT